jgi:hypothetical protein
MAMIPPGFQSDMFRDGTTEATTGLTQHRIHLPVSSRSGSRSGILGTLPAAREPAQEMSK